jgi:hypothetical protein
MSTTPHLLISSFHNVSDQFFLHLFLLRVHTISAMSTTPISTKASQPWSPHVPYHPLISSSPSCRIHWNHVCWGMHSEFPTNGN